MSRARLMLCVVAALYFGALVGLAFLPGTAANRASPLWPFLLFVPAGILLVLLLGTRRWWSAMSFGVLGAAWVEAAQTLWMPPGYADAWDVVWASTGVVVGVSGIVIGARMQRRSMRSHEAPSIVAQAGHREIPRAE
jgi:glycopeptide antibiotics resistance protein